MKLKAVIFDFDNTIIVSNEDHARSYLRMIKHTGLRIKGDEFRKRLGMSARAIFLDLIPGLSKKEIKRYVELEGIEYRKIVREKGIRTVVGIENMLKYLKKNKIKIGIASSASRKNMRVGMRMIGLGKYFQAVVDSDSVKHPKPNPEPLIKVMKKLKVRPSECVFVGDSIYDMIAAKRARVTGYGMATGFYSKGQLKSNGAKKAFRNHNEILKLFLSGRI